LQKNQDVSVLQTNGSGVLSFATPTGGTNTPAFSATPSTTQSITANTWTKITYGTEVLDSDNNFASSRFTPTTAGYYYIFLKIYTGIPNAYLYSNIYKNGSSYCVGIIPSGQAGGTTISTILYLNGSTDYVEAYTYQGTSNGDIDFSNGKSNTFGGFKLIGA